MSTTTESAEQMALRGLLLLVVEVQNVLADEEIDMFEKIEQVEDLVETDHAREYVQLARAALDNPLVAATPAAIPEADARTHI